MQQADFEKLLADTLAAHGRSPRTQETYTFMLRLFGRYLARFDKTVDAVTPSDVEAYQRYLVSERMVLRVEQGKGRKDRYVMLSETLLLELRTYYKAFRPQRWLFEGRTKGQPLSPSTAEKVFTSAAGRVGIRKGVSFHSLRHAFATHLLEGGTNIRVIQALLGHQCLTTTQVYTHVAKTYVNATASPLDHLKEKGKKEEPEKE
jgi:site-specific recombinase XerD